MKYPKIGPKPEAVKMANRMNVEKVEAYYLTLIRAGEYRAKQLIKANRTLQSEVDRLNVLLKEQKQKA